MYPSEFSDYILRLCFTFVPSTKQFNEKNLDGFAKEFPAIYLLPKGGDLRNSTARHANFASCSSHCFFNAERQTEKKVDSVFDFNGLTPLGIELSFSGLAQRGGEKG